MDIREMIENDMTIEEITALAQKTKAEVDGKNDAVAETARQAVIEAMLDYLQIIHIITEKDRAELADIMLEAMKEVEAEMAPIFKIVQTGKKKERPNPDAAIAAFLKTL